MSFDSYLLLRNVIKGVQQEVWPMQFDLFIIEDKSLLVTLNYSKQVKRKVKYKGMLKGNSSNAIQNVGFCTKNYYATVQIKNPTYSYCERDQALALSRLPREIMDSLHLFRYSKETLDMAQFQAGHLDQKAMEGSLQSQSLCDSVKLTSLRTHSPFLFRIIWHQLPAEREC